MRTLMYLLGALFCASVAVAFPKPLPNVPSQCIDPTFACQDLESARLCGVMKTCIHDIWATMTAPDDNDEICDICKEMVKEARDQLLSNMTQEEIKEVFEGSCKLIPVKLIADGCIKIVDEIIPELVEMLASRMDPNMVCTVSGLCYAVNKPVENRFFKILKLIRPEKKTDECSECVTMVSDIKTFLNTTPESDVEKYIENFCDEKIPKYLCDVVVNTYFPELYKYVQSTDAKVLCSSAGVCPKNCKLQAQVPVRDELTCEFCEHVLQHIKDLVTTNTTEEEFRTALLNFCSHLGTFSDKCTSLVNDYYDMLFDYIRKLDTKGMCTVLGLCNNEKCSEVIPLVKLIPPNEARRKIPLIKLEPAKPIEANHIRYPLVRLIPSSVLPKREKESNDIFQLPLERLVHPLSFFQKDTECAFCKAISFYLKQDLNGDRSKNNVRKAINEVCEKWVKDFPDHCQQFLLKYSMKVQIAIAKDMEFEEICPSIKACPAEKEKELKVTVISNLKDSPFCDLCKDAMNEVENQLSDPATKKKIENFLDQACNLLPKSLQDDCVSFINTNVDALIDILEQELKPDNICPALGLCPASSRVAVAQRVKDLECDVCKDVITSLRKNLEDPGSKKVVLTFLEEGCARLPNTLSQECKEFVDNNIDTIMGMLVERLDPDTVCSLFKFCLGEVKKEKIHKFKDIECDLCKEVVEKVEDMVKDKKTEDEIRDALDKVCSLLPKSLASKCEKFVNEYTELLISLLAQEMDPGMVCAALNLCPAEVGFTEWEAKAQDLECEGCQYALHFLQETLMNPDTQGEVKNVLKQMCDVLPESYAQNCEAFVDEYGDSLLALIAQEIDPSTMCYELKFCGNQTMLFETKPFVQLRPFSIDECSVCTTVVDYVDKLLEEDDVDKEITHLIEKVCNVIPASYKESCSTMLETYGPYILQMIGQLADSKEVCQDIDLCARPPGHVHLVGGNKCTFGPSYWCISQTHAAACKAEMFCKQKVWNK